MDQIAAIVARGERSAWEVAVELWGPRDNLYEKRLATYDTGDAFDHAAAVGFKDGRLDAHVVPAEQAVEMATLFGARAIGLTNLDIGIARAPADATDSHSLVSCADLAMYRAKLRGEAFAMYEQDFDDSGNLLRLAEELRGAITDDELVLHYQPQLDLLSG